MISIIICSINERLLHQVKQNIAETIGVDFEIIAIDNRNSPLGICEVYNIGAAKAQYDFLCFMHEDVKMVTQNWGLTVVQLLKPDTGIGLIGVAGSYYKPLIPSSWNGATKKTECIYILQGDKAKNPDEFELLNINPYNQKSAEVASIDGVWFCTTKAIATKYTFDAESFKKFHCYDIDFSLAVGQDHKVVVTYEILLAHFSKGSFDRTWIMETLKLHDKWMHYLPVLRGNLKEQEMTQIEKITFRHLLKQFVDLNLPLSRLRKLLWQKVFIKKVSVKLWINLNFHLYKYWGKVRRNAEYDPISFED